MLERYVEKLVGFLPDKTREANIKRARSVINFGYKLYSTPLRAGSLPILRLARSSSLIGTPIPRFYWNHFLVQHRSVFHGHALEIGTSTTVRRMGGKRLNAVDVINITPDTGVTIVSDLCKAWDVPSDTFDVFLNQFTLHMVVDDVAALYHSIRILKPSGHLVVNFPCMSGFFPEGVDYGGYPVYIERWYTPTQVERLLKRFVPPSAYTTRVYGNRNAKASYVLDIGAEAFPERHLLRHAPQWPVLMCAVIKKPENWKPEFVPPDAPELP